MEKEQQEQKEQEEQKEPTAWELREQQHAEELQQIKDNMAKLEKENKEKDDIIKSLLLGKKETPKQEENEEQKIFKEVLNKLHWEEIK